jgi:hypothetical protein
MGLAYIPTTTSAKPFELLKFWPSLSTRWVRSYRNSMPGTLVCWALVRHPNMELFDFRVDVMKI